MRPDGGVSKYFPFFFVEVKRGAHDLESTFIINLHNASQALLNVFIWMLRAGLKEVFFNRVYIFSIVLNAQEINLRVYRVMPVLNINTLNYHFNNIIIINGYSKD
jgi:hypothetical protein